MKVAEIQFNFWEKPMFFLSDDLDLKVDDYVIIETEAGLEIGKIIAFKEKIDKTLEAEDQVSTIKNIIRKASLSDLEVLEKFEKSKEEALAVCKKLILKNQLAMKLVDVHFSFDNKRITFAFIANGRIDFRSLVKDLTRHFQKNIRLQQLGVRDEAKIDGDVGACGIIQCCKTHLNVLGNVKADQAQMQQVSHRGADRLSGICGRLKCCLRYENDLYKELAENFPALGTIIKTPRGKGEVIEWHILKQTVNVKIAEDSIIEVPVDKIN